MSKDIVATEGTPFLLYEGENETVHVKVLMQAETIWLTQRSLSELFQTSKQNISLHIQNIFDEGELTPSATVKDFLTVQTEGKREVTRSLEYYNLDAIIAVGYRVNSRRATQFRIWATNTLKEYIKKGFVMDDERLKQAETVFGEDYFKELLERVRSIRASERRIYLQITDIFAECSIDYNPKSDTTRQFYAHVQDKFHYAITGQTASEIIHNHVDASKPLMGIKSYKNSPDGRILKSDTTIGKNYLQEDDIKKLERAVSSFFDYIEGIIERRTSFTMESFAESVNKFLEFNEYKILEGFGKITRKQAEQKAIEEYEKYNKTLKIESDFDKRTKAFISAQNSKGKADE